MSLIVLGCSEVTQDPPSSGDTLGPIPPGWFEDISQSSGLTFIHDPGPTGTYFMPQSMCSGGAALDFDNDGLLDLYLLHFGGPDSLSKNQLFRQTAPGKFEDVSPGSGLDIADFCHGVAVGDANNDGLPDVLVNGFGFVRLFENLGQGKFREVTKQSGLVNLSWGVSAAWVDYDRDGWLDVCLVNYLDYDDKVECKAPNGKRDFCGPNNFTGTTSKLYRNRGEANFQFEDVSLSSGIGKLRGPGLGVTVADFNGDHWPDIFISNDGKPNHLWINQKDGKFVDEAVSRGVALTAMGRAYAGMGIALGDANNDGLLDLFVTHLGTEQHNLWQQGPAGQFRDRTSEAALNSTSWKGTGWGTLFADFNNDGHQDLVIANGKIARGGDASGTNLGFWETYAEKNQLLVNEGGGKFRDASLENGVLCNYWNVARGLIQGDFDNDGAPDLVVCPIGDQARLFRNVAKDRGHWLKVRVIDPKLKRDALGAEVTIRAAGKTFFRVIAPADSFLSSSSPIAHFGLGQIENIDSIEVVWPNGSFVKETYPGGSVNRELRLQRGEGQSP